jgi:K+-sensing histidine kinase KdpD
MTDSNPQKREPVPYDELLQQNWELRHQVEELRAQEVNTWNLLAATGRKLQVHSASIKAAVSSLLNYDIFWDSANQHEFLETIDSSVNQLSDIIVLLTLAFRSQANSLVLRKDHHLLQEILSISQMAAAKKFPQMKLEISFPPAGKPVLVDYEYLTKALLLLYEVLYARAPSDPIRVAANESDGAWFLDFIGPDNQIIQAISQMQNCKTQPATTENLSAENILRLYIICEILHLQDITVDAFDGPDQRTVFRLCVPVK